jgi:hypothetical protein
MAFRISELCAQRCQPGSVIVVLCRMPSHEANRALLLREYQRVNMYIADWNRVVGF